MKELADNLSNQFGIESKMSYLKDKYPILYVEMFMKVKGLEDFFSLWEEMQYSVLIDLLPKLKRMREEGKLGPIRSREAEI